MPLPDEYLVPEQQPGAPPTDPFFTQAIFYLEDDTGTQIDWSTLATGPVAWVTRWLLSKNQNGEAVFTCRIEEHNPEAIPVPEP